MDWIRCVDYCDVFISCLDSHSDGTHSLQRIHWWANDVNSPDLFRFGSETNSSTSWMAWGWTVPLHQERLMISNPPIVHNLQISSIQWKQSPFKWTQSIWSWKPAYGCILAIHGGASQSNKMTINNTFVVKCSKCFFIDHKAVTAWAKHNHYYTKITSL